MALKSKTVTWIVALLALTLIGLTALQSSLLSGAMELKESSFRSNVMSALGNVSESLSIGEVTTIFLSTSLDDSSSSTRAMMAVFSGDSAVDIESEWTRPRPGMMRKETIEAGPLQIEDNKLRYKVGDSQQVRITRRLVGSRVDSVLVDSFHTPGEYEITLKHAAHDAGMYTWNSANDSSFEFVNHAEFRKNFLNVPLDGETQPDSGKMKLVAQVMKNFINAELVPVEERLDSINVDSILQETLTESGIDLAYAYAVYSAPRDSARIISDEKYREDLADSDFRVRLFPEDVFAEPAYLSVFFPDHRMFIWGQISPMLGATALFTLLIVGSFGYSIRALNRQKRVSELMVDFINNMTHEFKTPIATVALAAEAIGREEVVSDPEKIRRFNEMIVSETGRMRGQAERILQMAALEERTLELAPVTVDLHEILDDAIRAIELRVADENGIIVREFKATNSKLEADKVHLLNIAHNLLDNANKYADGAPHITISTFDSDRGVGFRIVDRGIGIEAQDQKQVFEKYFRASTGNVHNVKGFGLGLSYVKLIVDQHNGEITLHSIPGEKTEVEIILPHNQNNESAN